MNAIDSTTQDRENGVVRSLGEIDNESNHLRRELDRLRKKRAELKAFRSAEIKVMENEYRNAKEKLQRKLPEHANIPTYRRSLRYFQGDASKSLDNKTHSTNCILPSSNYIIQQETPLLSAMHRSFCVLPHQIETNEREYEREIYPYFRKEIQDLHLDCQEMTDKWMSLLSEKAEENDALYDSYRTELENIEAEVKRRRRLLFEQRSGMNAARTTKDICDEGSLLSETDHSSDSEDENSSRVKDGVGFFKEALHLFSASPRRDTAAHSKTESISAPPSKTDSITDVFHEHLCKGGNAFQVAANTFLLPFTSKGD